MYETPNGQSIANGYQPSTNTTATFYSAVQYNSAPSTATAAVVQPQQTIPVYYQQQAYQIQYQQPQFYVQQQQQVWTTAGIPAQQQQQSSAFYQQPQYQYTAATSSFQQQSYQQNTAGPPLVNLTRLVNQSAAQTSTTPIVIATQPAIIAPPLPRVPSPTRSPAGVSPASSTGTGTSHMYPVRPKGIKGARTKAKMRELLKEEAEAEAIAAAKKAKRPNTKKTDKTIKMSPGMSDSVSVVTDNIGDTISSVISSVPQTNVESGQPEETKTAASSIPTVTPRERSRRISEKLKSPDPKEAIKQKAKSSPKAAVTETADVSSGKAKPSPRLKIKLATPEKGITIETPAASDQETPPKKPRLGRQPKNSKEGIELLKQSSSKKEPSTKLTIDEKKLGMKKATVNILPKDNLNFLLQSSAASAATKEQNTSSKTEQVQVVRRGRPPKKSQPDEGEMGQAHTEKQTAEIAETSPKRKPSPPKATPPKIRLKKQVLKRLRAKDVVKQLNEIIPHEVKGRTLEEEQQTQSPISPTPNKPKQNLPGATGMKDRISSGTPKIAKRSVSAKKRRTSAENKPSFDLFASSTDGSHSSRSPSPAQRKVQKYTTAIRTKVPTVRVKASDLNKLKLKTQDRKLLTVGRQVLRVQAEKVRFYRGDDEEDVEEIARKAALHERPQVEFDDSIPFKCTFCNLKAYFYTLGDLFGPYYTDEQFGNGKTRKKETWLHAGCGLWAPGVVLIGSTLLGLTEAVEQSKVTTCTICSRKGATIPCLTRGCSKATHLPCALVNEWVLENDTFRSYCMDHDDCGTPGAPRYT